MKMNKTLSQCRQLLFLLLTIGSIFSAQATEMNGPVDLLQGIANQMIQDLQQHKITLQSNRQYVYSLAYRLVVPHVDATEMSRRVLPPQTWEKANASERAAFLKQFIALLVHTYASALASYTDQTVTFYPIRGGYEGRQAVEVNSQITSGSGAPPVSVRYRLLHEGGGWKLYDMSVEGVSVIESFRSQFADALAEGDITTLTKQLAAHNANSASN